jgi:hypothetical protein
MFEVPGTYLRMLAICGAGPAGTQQPVKALDSSQRIWLGNLCPPSVMDSLDATLIAPRYSETCWFVGG